LNRIFSIDIIRGFAVVLMIIFHLAYDIDYFGFLSIPLWDNIFWIGFRVFIITIFLLLVGVSLYLAYKDGINLNKFKKRILILFLSAIVISISTIFILPKSWIYFGVIHFILTATFVGIAFIKLPKISLILGFTIIVSYYFGYLQLYFFYDIFQPILNLPSTTVDLVRFFPWFGVVLIGIYLGSINILNIDIKQNHLTRTLQFFGQHALIIYLAHQPLFFAIFIIFK